MDRLIYTAMSGAQHILDQQTTNSNNLANVSSNGFRAQIDTFRAVPIVGAALNTRAFVVNATSGTDFTPGPIQPTGRNLDVAIEGKGWFAVQRPDGTEGLTRNGSFKINSNSILTSPDGLPVVGDGGPITVPPGVILSVAGDGTISAVNDGSNPGPSNPIGRLKLVNPPEAGLTRGTDGLFVSSGPAPVDETVKVVNGSLEGSNVNVVQSMVNMISLARQFDLQMNMLKTTESDDAKASEVLQLN